MQIQGDEPVAALGEALDEAVADLAVGAGDQDGSGHGCLVRGADGIQPLYARRRLEGTLCAGGLARACLAFLLVWLWLLWTAAILRRSGWSPLFGCDSFGVRR